MKVAPEKTIVILIHGIRTAARWQSRVAGAIERETGARVIPLKYGYYDILRFWCPLGICRLGPIERLRKQIEGIREQYPGYRIVIFAHSFGTYALSRILLENSHFKVDRIVLCGSIIPENYDWSRVASQIRADDMREAVVNDCGTKDVWPVVARSISWGYGDTGTNGFGKFNVRDRFHPLTHSEFFDDAFVRKYWISAVRGEKFEFSPGDRKGDASPGWFTLFQFPLRWLVVAGVVAGLAGIVALAGIQFPHFAQRCPTGTTRVGEQCFDVANLKSRKELDEQVSTLLIDINRTLSLKGGELFPAMDSYVGEPTAERWINVQSISEKLLTHLGKSLDDIAVYDDSLVRLDDKVIFIGSDARVEVGENFFKAFNEARSHFTGRETIVIQMRGAGPTPDPIRVQGWRNQLADLHNSLTRTLEEMLRRLRSA